ncbi:MAG: hemolysin family protein [Longimicrobiales bacterium]|nr:hemolysin family protein [Longimicrobiales bacterium]
MTTLAIVVVLLVASSALITAGETAVHSVTETRLRTLLDEGFQGARELVQLRGQPHSLRGAIHVLATGLNFAALGLLVLLGANLSGTRSAGFWLAVSLPSVLFLTEILPRALVARRPVRLALLAAPVVLGGVQRAGWLLSPFMRLEDVLAGRDRNGEEDDEEREVREIASLGREKGIVGLEEHALVERAFRLDERAAWDVMTPRVDMFTWPESRTVAEVVGELEEVPHSRVPVFGASVDDITGIVYVREVYETWVAGDRDLPLRELARDAFFVPGSMSLAQLLRDFQARRLHMGIVADEFGGTDGLVTLEDVLEELVGEIVDETDVEEEELQQVGHDEWVADGSVDLREVNEAFGVEIPREEHRSLNGFLLEELGYVPEPGESLARHGVVIEVLEASETQVLRARIRRDPGGRTEASDDD